MPGTTRYSATFDRTYEEDDSPAEAPIPRRGRSQSLQVESLTAGRRYSSLAAIHGSHSRSPSIDKGQGTGAEIIPTRNGGKPTFKAHNNPFQFVKVGSCSLYKKAEEQLKKVQEVKKPPVVKEDEEEWQSNLDSWKSRRRKMSEDAFRRQEEWKKLELEQQSSSLSQLQQQKKIKKFSEMVEERAHRGRALSLCLFPNPLEANDWVFEANKSRTNRNHSFDPLHFSGESAESSNMNSEDDNENDQKLGDSEHVNNGMRSPKLNGLINEHNTVQSSGSNSSISKASELSELDVSQDSITPKDRTSNGGFIDSGLESLSSSHRACDIPDSCSDFSQDSGSSLDCDSPRVSRLITTGVELLEEFSSRDEEELSSQKEKSPSKNIATAEKVSTKPPVKSKGNLKKGETVCNNSELANKDVAKKSTNSPIQCGLNKKSVPLSASNKSLAQSGRSIESDNEMLVDDLEELAQLQRTLPLEKTLNSSDVCAKSEHTSKNLADLTNGSLNVIYQSSPQAKKLSPSEHAQNENVTSSTKRCVDAPAQKTGGKDFSLIAEVPVDKVAEEMERLILEQLEAEEQAKEISANTKLKSTVDIQDKSDIETPSKHTEPPKEKPPPPPSTTAACNGAQKTGPLKRVNSTKRILKEISKRRSDFLGIDDNSDEESTLCDKSVPPPVLEDILRVEREQDRLRRQLATTTSSQEHVEDEIARKEREIIENLETEERLKSCHNINENSLVPAPDVDFKAGVEEDRINSLKEERKQNEQRLLSEQIRLEEAKQLHEREEQIRKQEADKCKGVNLIALSSSGASVTNIAKTSTDSISASAATNGSFGDGTSNKEKLASAKEVASEFKEAPPATAVKPLKKKEALRKERERLRQEQEALQKEREEHRRKIQMEQDEQKKNAQKSHVPDAPMPRVGPPPHAKPAFHPQLTPPSHTSQVLREGAHFGTSNCSSNSQNSSPASQTTGSQQAQKASRLIRGPVARSKGTCSEAKIQQRVPCVRKQADAPSESRYNQNHWLIQEAEMRRIVEQKERQHSQGHVEAKQATAPQLTFHQPAYADNYRGKMMAPQRPAVLPVAQNMSGGSTNYAVPTQLHSPDQQWSFGQPLHPNLQSRKSVPSAGADMSHAYSRNFDPNMYPPAKPSRVPLDKQEQMLSVSGRKRCSHCGEELGRGAAMIIESLQLYYHIQCFQCCVCQAQLGNGSCGTDVRVRNSKLHCHNCYSNDEAGLKFSQV